VKSLENAHFVCWGDRRITLILRKEILMAWGGWTEVRSCRLLGSVPIGVIPLGSVFMLLIWAEAWIVLSFSLLTSYLFGCDKRNNSEGEMRGECIVVCWKFCHCTHAEDFRETTRNLTQESVWSRWEPGNSSIPVTLVTDLCVIIVSDKRHFCLWLKFLTTITTDICRAVM